MTAAVLAIAFISGLTLNLPYPDMVDCRNDANLLNYDSSVVCAECMPVYHMANARAYVPPMP